MKIASDALKRLTLLIAAGLIASLSAALAEDHSDSFNIETITCWELTGLEEADRAPALTLIYGYVAGKHDREVHEGSAIGKALEKVGQLCESNPDMYVASAVERATNTKGQ